MLQKLSHYFTALAVLLVCAAIYHTSMTRWLTPAEMAHVQPKPPTDLPAMKQNLSDLFPPGAWQLGDCNRLMTENGILLFENQEQAADDRWKLSPVTLIIGRGLQPMNQADPVVLTANEGADIQFAEELQMIGSGGTPLIRRGQMNGTVTIQRKSSKREAESLYVETSDVIITNQQVSTTEIISMKIGSATLIGQDMTINLALNSVHAASTASETSVLDNMELVYLKHLEIPLAGFSNRKNTPGESSKPDPGTVFISCDGGLRYDFMTDQLSVRDKIDVVRRSSGQKEDRFTSDQLDLVLRDPINSETPRDGPIDWIDRFRAIGNPAVISLPSQDFELLAEKIEFDSVEGLLSAHGRTGVQLRRGPVGARLTQFVYQYDPDEPRTLGVIEALGAGIVNVNDPELEIKQVRWRNRFRMEPLSKTTLDQVDKRTLTSKVRVLLEGEILANLSDGGTCRAEQIEGILKPADRIPDRTAHEATTHLTPIGRPRDQLVVAQPEIDTTNKTEKPEQRFVPQSFEARGHVVIDSAAILANANLVFLEFVDQVDPKPSVAGRDMTDNDSGSDSDKNPSSLRQWVAQPGKGASDHSVDQPRPVVRGDEVSALLALTNQGIVAQDMSVSGGIELHHSIAVADQLLQAKMTGDELRMIRRGGKDFLHLGSMPDSNARLELGDGFFVGPSIDVWPTENVVQIKGAGEFLVPSKVMPQSFGEQGGEIQWIQTPHCRWNGTMHFDGKTATLTDGVHIQASLLEGEQPWAVHVDGDRMEVDLVSKVDVQQTQSMRNATIDEIRVLRSPSRPVMIRAEQKDQNQRVVSRHELISASLNFTPVDGGVIIGEGPGWYRGWMLSEGTNSLAKRLSLPASANAADESEQKTPVLNGVHLAFHQAMRADLATKMLSFLGGVRAGMRELKTWEESVDVRSMERLAIGESTLDCRDLRFGISPEMARNMPRIPGMPLHWEMESVGGVVVRTRDEQGWLQCTAGRAAYASRKGRLIIEKSADRSATVMQTQPDGSPGFNFTVPYASVDPKTFDVSTKLENASIGNLPTRSPR